MKISKRLALRVIIIELLIISGILVVLLITHKHQTPIIDFAGAESAFPADGASTSGSSQTIFSNAEEVKQLPELLCYSDDSCNSVVLTFDDGPYRHINTTVREDCTGHILDILKQENVPGNFFVLGVQFDTNVVKTGETYQKYCEWLKRMFNEGHSVGIHDRNHIQFYRQSRQELEASLSYTKKRIEEISGHQPSIYVRSPGGSISQQVEKYLHENGYKHTFWHINSEPRNNATPNEILNHIIRELNKGKRGIILMHDRTAYDYLEALIRFLKTNQIGIISLEEWDKRYGLPANQYTSQIGRFD